MINDIKEKLRIELSKPITSENQVIYILSRVRKILEIDVDINQAKYKKLKFYCDWALHSRIDKGTKTFQEEFEKVAQGDMESLTAILTFQYFDTEFFDFMEQYHIPPESYKTIENNMAFKEFLAQIYEDTPLIVTLEKKFEIRTNRGVFTREEGQGKIEIGFKITPIQLLTETPKTSILERP